MHDWIQCGIDEFCAHSNSIESYVCHSIGMFWNILLHSLILVCTIVWKFNKAKNVMIQCGDNI